MAVTYFWLRLVICCVYVRLLLSVPLVLRTAWVQVHCKARWHCNHKRLPICGGSKLFDKIWLAPQTRAIAECLGTQLTGCLHFEPVVVILHAVFVLCPSKHCAACAVKCCAFGFAGSKRLLPVSLLLPKIDIY